MKIHMTNIIKASIGVFGLAATLAMFFPALTYNQLSFDGYEMLFGSELLNINPFHLGTIANAYFPFSILALFGFFLPMLGGIIILISQRYIFASIICFVAGTFFLSLLPNHIDLVYTIGGMSNVLSPNWSVGWGLIAALGFSGLGTIGNMVLLLKNIHT